MFRALLLSGVVLASPAWAQEVWTFNGPQGALGPSANFASTPSGLITTAMGFTTTGSAVSLFQKNSGSGEVGLGLTDDPSGLNEDTNGNFIQLSLNALNGNQLLDLSVGTGSSTVDQRGNPEVWGIGFSNTSGHLGATALTGTGNQTVHLNASGSSFVDITDTTNGLGNGILVTEMDAPSGIVPISVPEPPSALILGSAFLALLLGTQAIRRRA